MSPTQYDDERIKLEQDIFRLVQSFEERTGFHVFDIQFFRDTASRPMSDETYAVLIGVHVEVERKQ